MLIDGQDWSAWYGPCAVSYASLEDETSPGKIPIIVSLQIKQAWNNPESLDPLTNPIRWRIGQNVEIRPRNDANDAWLTVPWTYLKILSQPQRPGSGPLTLDLGCKVAWYNQSQFDNDLSGVIYGQPELANAVATRTLINSGIPASELSLGVWPNQIDRPLGKVGTNSFINQVADLAYANEWRYLHQNASGQITATALSLTSTGEIATVTRGQNDIIYEPLGDPERPAEKTRVSALGFALETIDNPSTDIQNVIVDANDISPNSFGNVVAERIETTRLFTTGASPSTTEREQVSKIEALIFQDPQNPTQRVDYTDKIVASYYETGKLDPTEARLIQRITTIRQRGRSLDPDDLFVNMRDVYRKQEDFTYGSGELMTRYQSTEEQVAIQLDPEATDPWTFIVTEDLDYAWTEYLPSKFDRDDTEKTPLIRNRSNIDRGEAKPDALQTLNRVYSRRTPNKPFQTEYFDAGIDEGPQEFTGQALYTPDGGATGFDKERSYVVKDGMINSNGPLVTLAGLHRDLAIGRERGYLIELEINDALLQSGPLPEISVIDTDSQSYTYKGDGLTFEFLENRATAGCAGIWVGGGYVEAANLTATIPQGEFSEALQSASLSLIATIAQGNFSEQLNLDNLVDLAATISQGSFSEDLQPDDNANLAATTAQGSFSEALTDVPNLAAFIPQGEFSEALLEELELTAVIPQGEFSEGLSAGGTDADADAYIARLTGTYSAGELAAINDFFVALKTAGIYLKGDAIYLFAADSSSDAVLNLVSTSYTATATNMTFTARQGFTGNGTTSFIDSTFNPNTASGNYALNTGSVAAYLRLNIAEEGLAFGARSTSGNDTRVFAYPRRSSPSDQTLSILNARNTTISSTISDCRRLFTTSRTASNLTTSYHDGTNLGTSSETPDGLVARSIYFGGYNNDGTLSIVSTNEFAFGWIGGDLSSSEVADLDAAVDDLLTAFGANV